MSKVSKLSQIVAFSKKYPISRGIASYALIWPVGSLVQQTIVGEEKYDYARAARFCLYGSCYVAPTLHCWLKIANAIWPLSTFRSALTKALLEQITYTPFAMISFYFGMTLLEGKTINDGIKEVKAKFLPTYKIGVIVWPILQTFNYSMIRPRNRVVFVSLCSLMWTSFLAYMKHLEHDQFLDEPDVKASDIETDTVGATLKTVHHLPSDTTHDKTWLVNRQLDR